jgi:threonine/homoserine/homoserine lactone efflux protein
LFDMFESQTLLLFMTATLALNLTPGPDMLYVIARSAAEGRRAGVVSALGIAAGTLVHTAAVALGLASLLAAVPVAFNVVKLAGAAYLILLGIRALRSSGEIAAPVVERARLRRIFAQGAVTNILNPKVALFFLAFLPQFVDARSGPVALRIVILGVLFNISGTIVNVLVAVISSSASRWSQARLRAPRVMRWLTGGVFIGLGLRLALLQRSR